MHTHKEPFTFSLSKRKHKRPPRMFVVCSLCGNEFQAVRNLDGTIHTFTTNRKTGSAMRVRSFRLTDKQNADIKRWKREGWPKE
jgi:hypothetical protein